jgi:hypothetical protein
VPGRSSSAARHAAHAELTGADAHAELHGVGARAERYRPELANGRWAPFAGPDPKPHNNRRTTRHDRP